MKKQKIELLVILTISIFSSVLLPNFFKGITPLVILSVSEFLIWFLSIFLLFSILFFSLKPKEKLTIISDGYQELYNEKNQITKKSFFQGGILHNGLKYIYKKDGSLSHIEKCINGVYTVDRYT
jgi:hypothetical protein